MIYLRTGANGAGKTLLTLRDVREKSLEESRPVYYNGRFEMLADFGWTKIDAKDWESVPDGAIFLFDECHNDFPLRSASAPVPQYVKSLAEHRRRGFDFFLITQHPMNLDAFVRRLIGSPGWHQHLKRASGAPLVSVIEWAAVTDQPQKNGSGATGSVKMVPYPKEVYTWYQSTSLDTAKVKIPRQVIVLGVCVLAIPLLGFFGWKDLMKNAAPKSQAALTSVPAGTMANAPGAAKTVQTPGEYVASFRPRLEGFPQTAERYDELTKPTDAPYPAACVQSKDRCQCYSQQATRLVVPVVVCQQIVAGGYFKDWGQTLAAANAGHPVASTPAVVPTATAAPVMVATAAQTGPHPFEAVLPKPKDPNAPKPARTASDAS